MIFYKKSIKIIKNRLVFIKNHAFFNKIRIIIKVFNSNYYKFVTIHVIN